MLRPALIRRDCRGSVWQSFPLTQDVGRVSHGSPFSAHQSVAIVHGFPLWPACSEDWLD